MTGSFYQWIQQQQQRPVALHSRSPRSTVNPAAVQALVSDGAVAAASAGAAAADVEAVITMLPAPQHVKETYLSPGGVLEQASEGTLLIDSSTVDPGTAQEMSACAAKANLRMIDAPVSGGVGGAEAGTLSFMAGGDKEAFDASVAILKDMGKNIVHCGPAGTGSVAKLANNWLLGTTMCGLAEAMAMGVKLGADPKVLASIINTSTGRCWSSDTYNPVPGVMDGVPASRGYEGGFAAELMLKDMRLAQDAARALGMDMATGNKAAEAYATLKDTGMGRKDFGAVFDWLVKK